MVLVKTLRVGVHDPQLDIIIEAARVDSSYQTIIEAVTSKCDWRLLPQHHPFTVINGNFWPMKKMLAS